MTFRSLLSIFLNLAAIVACGGLGAIVGYAVRASFGFGGVGGAIVATSVAMLVATIAWAVGYSALRAMRWIR